MVAKAEKIYWMVQGKILNIMIIDNQQLILKRKVQRLSLVRGVQYKR